MTDLLAIGTRKGLWLARSDDDRRTWTVDGPHLLAQEVAAVSVDTRRDAAAGARRHPVRPLGPDGDVVRRPRRAPGRRPTTARSASPRTPAPRWPASGSCAPTPPTGPDVVWAGCEPHSLWRSTDGGCSLRAGPRPAATTRTGPTWEPGGGGGAVHTVLPDPASDRVTVAMSTGGVYVSEDGGDEVGAAQPGHHAPSSCPTRRPSTASACTRSPSTRAAPTGMYAQNHFGVFRTDDGGGSWTSIADGLPADFGFPIVASPRTPGHGLGGPAGRRHAAGAAGRPAAGAPHRATPARRWTEVGRRACPTAPGRRCMRDAFCADERDPTGVYFGTRDGCVYASADEGETFTLVADHLPDVLDRPRRRGCRDASQVVLPGVLADLAGGEQARRRRAGGRRRWPTCSTRWPTGTRCSAGGSATRPARCGAS